MYEDTIDMEGFAKRNRARTLSRAEAQRLKQQEQERQRALISGSAAREEEERRRREEEEARRRRAAERARREVGSADSGVPGKQVELDSTRAPPITAGSG